jgi:hypothetical protein
VRLAMVGLGRMGGNMAERLRAHDHDVVGFDVFSEATDVPTLEACIEAVEAPRLVWVMVPAGGPTEHTIDSLSSLLSPGDVVVDGGNSNWRDSVRRATRLADLGIGFIDAGTSGGVWGRTEGYCLMVGGEPEHVAFAQPAFDALAPEGGFVHTGAAGCRRTPRATSCSPAPASTSMPRAPSARGGRGASCGRGCSTCSCAPSTSVLASTVWRPSPRTPARAGGPCRRPSSAGSPRR